MEKMKLNLESAFDICLWAISFHKFRRSIQTKYRKISKGFKSVSGKLANTRETIQVALEDSLEETLLKISVVMFTIYYELYFIKINRDFLPFHSRIFSHFRALFYYRKGEYGKLLNACNSIISDEVFNKFIPETRTHTRFLERHQDWHCVSVLFAFQTLFRNDVTCLTGLIALIDPSLFSFDRHTLV